MPGLHRGGCAGALSPRRWGVDRLLGSAGAGPLGMWAECPLSPGGTGHRERDFPPMLTPTPTHSLPSHWPGGGPRGGTRRTAPSGAAWVPCPRWGSVSSEVDSAGPFWAAGVPLGGSCCPGLLSFSLDVQPRDVGRMQARPDPMLIVRTDCEDVLPTWLCAPGLLGGPSRGVRSLSGTCSPRAPGRCGLHDARGGADLRGPVAAQGRGGGLCTFTMAQPVHAPRGRAGRGLPGAAACRNWPLTWPRCRNECLRVSQHPAAVTGPSVRSRVPGPAGPFFWGALRPVLSPWETGRDRHSPTSTQGRAEGVSSRRPGDLPVVWKSGGVGVEGRIRIQNSSLR